MLLSDVKNNEKMYEMPFCAPEHDLREMLNQI